jgi:hypothetical protein
MIMLYWDFGRFSRRGGGGEQACANSTPLAGRFATALIGAARRRAESPRQWSQW